MYAWNDVVLEYERPNFEIRFYVICTIIGLAKRLLEIRWGHEMITVVRAITLWCEWLQYVVGINFNDEMKQWYSSTYISRIRN